LYQCYQRREFNSIAVNLGLLQDSDSFVRQLVASDWFDGAARREFCGSNSCWPGRRNWLISLMSHCRYRT
jgi:hypothetical protein